MLISALVTFLVVILILYLVNLLPLEANVSYRINLAGAWLNRANALFAADLEMARTSVRTALGLITDAAPDHPAATEVALSARRTLLAIIGRELSTPRDDARRRLAEAGDLIDDGLALARMWETRRVSTFRPAAVQLFQAGAILYASHQPHFLADFLQENPSLARELPGVVQAMIARARRTSHERGLLADSADPLSRTFNTLAELSTLAQRLTLTPPST